MKNIVTIPRTDSVFLRESIIGVTNPCVTGGHFLRMSLKIIGVGFQVEIQTEIVNGVTGEEEYFERHEKFIKECQIWHAEVVNAVFGDTNE
jgi:hypothetical protein